MTGLLNDIRHSARGFARTPGPALGLLFTIALGIGSNVVVHGFIRGLIVRDSPLTNLGRIVSLFAREPRGATALVSYEDFATIRREHMFEWVGAARESKAAVELPDRSEILTVGAVTRDLVAPLNLALNDGAVISHRVWQKEFAGRSKVPGERILIEGVETRVDGVAPDWLDGLYSGRPVDIWVPLREDSLQGPERAGRSLWVLGRLRQDVSIEPAQALMPASRADSGAIHAHPYTRIPPEMTYGLSQIETVLSISTGIVFFIACGNVAAFLLGRSSARAHQTSIRVALGASRRQLARQLFSDSTLICIAGGALGTLLAVWTAQIVPALFFEQDAGQLAFAPDLYWVIASAGVCVGIMIACGVIPLLEVRLDRPADVLRRDRSDVSQTTRVWRAGVVVAQMACCVILMTSTGLLFEGLQRGFETSAGHRLGQPAFVTVQASSDLAGQYLHLKYFEDVERSVRSVAGATAIAGATGIAGAAGIAGATAIAGAAGIAWAQRVPGSRPLWQSLRIEPPSPAYHPVTLDAATFAADSPPLFELPVRAGRMFGGGDTPRTCRVAILNEEAAEQLFEGDAVGRALEDTLGRRVDIIGVALSRKPEGGKDAASRPAIYFYGEQEDSSYRVRQERFRVAVAAKRSNAALEANIVSGSYFDAMGLTLIEGRSAAGAPPAGRDCRVGLVNREAAELYFAGNAVGAAVIDELGRRTEIIGVVHSSPLGIFQPRVEPAIYFQMSSDSPHQMTLILHAREMTEGMLDAFRRQIEGVPGGGPAPLVVKTLEAHFDQTALAPLRIATVIVAASTAMALALSIVGLHGALADSVRRRGRELAIRVALGARRRHVIFQVLDEGGRLAAAGAVAGIIGSLLLARFLAQFSGGSARLWMLMSAPLVLSAVVAAASLLPARRALTVEPVQIMREGA